MKRLLIMILLMFLLTGCSENLDSQDSKESDMFVYIQVSQNYNIAYHKDTKVMYAISRGSYNAGTFTVLVNPDGTPMLYEAESEE